MVVTQASIIAAVSLFGLAQQRRSEWLSRRVQLWAFAIVSVAQLRLLVFLGIEPIVSSGPSIGAVPQSILLLGALQFAGLFVGSRAVHATAA